MRVDAVRAVTAVVLAAGLVVGGTSSAWATDEAAAAPTAAVTTADPGPTSAEAAQPTEDAAATPTDTPATSSPVSEPSASEPAGSSAAPQPDAEPQTTAPTTEPAPSSPDPTPAPDTTPAPSPAEGTGPTTGLPSTGGTTATASRGCIGETTVVVTVPGLEVGTPVTVRIDALAPVAAEVLPGGKVVVETIGLLDEAVTVSITVQVEDLLFLTSATIADVCTATGSITVSRDCLTPGLVSATVDVAGLQDRLYGVAVIGVTDAGQQVLLASADVEPVAGRLTGTYPLVSVVGTVPLEAITGISLVLDGETFASVAGDVVDLVSCVPAPTVPVVPDPVAAVPASPAPPVPTTTAPVTHPVARPAAPSTTRAVPVAAPATLARTGDDVGSLALLGLGVLALGAGTTVAARRPVR